MKKNNKIKSIIYLVLMILCVIKCIVSFVNEVYFDFVGIVGIGCFFVLFLESVGLLTEKNSFLKNKEKKTKEKESYFEKNERKILPIIFAILLLLFIAKIIVAPRVMDFVAVISFLIVLINLIIQKDDEKYLSKKEYNQAYEEWKALKEENPELKNFNKKKRMGLKEYVYFLIVIGIMCGMSMALGYNNYRGFIWSYERDIKELKEDNINRYGHFPSEIPDEAKDVKWYYRGTLGTYYGYLKMQVDDEYIENLEKTFTDKDTIYESALLNGEYGVYNHEGYGFLYEYFSGCGREEFEFVCPAKEGDVVMYITHDDGYGDPEQMIGVVVNRESNTVVYFSRRYTR